MEHYRAQGRPIVQVLNGLLLIISLLAFVSLIAEYGFYLTPRQEAYLHVLDILIVWFFVFQALVKFAFARDHWEYMKARWFDLLLVFFILLQSVLLIRHIGLDFFREVIQKGEVAKITKLYMVAFQVFLIFTFVIQAVRFNQRISMLRLHPAQILLGSFLIIILIGTGLLLLPRAVQPGNQISFLDALFTATSATCVTGLIVVDTGNYFSPLGQWIILILIQIGGLGLMTYSSFFALILRRSISLREKSMLREILNYENMGLIGKLLFYTILVTFGFELVGTVLLFFGLEEVHPDWSMRLYSAVFHSISAFCNAGFSLYSSSMVEFQTNYLVLGTVMVLIVLGGLGFPVLLNLSGMNLRPSTGRKRIWSVQTRIVLWVSGGLIGLGMGSYLLFEAHNTLEGLSWPQRILHSLFQSITTRTAGFNTLDMAQLTLPTVLIFLVLMFIGASPGSTGGGIKTTTVSILTAGVFAVIRGKNRLHLFKKNIPFTVLNRALVVFLFSLLFIFISVLLLTLVEQKDLVDLLFEAFSAFGTVGLSRGITPDLTPTGKCIVILLMFFGRLGALTMSLAITAPRETVHYDYPRENVMVG